MHTFRTGDKVYIINCTMSGTFRIEGQATIMNRIKDVDEQYIVVFSDNMPVERFVDPAAQKDPAGLVARLNDRTA